MSDSIEQVAEQAVEEWDYTEAESQFDLPPQSVSIPCQLRFTEPPRRDVERFHEALESRDYAPMASSPTRGFDNPHYEGEICSTDHYNRVRIIVFRSDVVRLFPKDGHVPSLEELTTLLHAITEGFDAPLKHDPIERADGNTGQSQGNHSDD